MHYTDFDLSLRPELRELRKHLRRERVVPRPDEILDRATLEARNRDVAFAREILSPFGEDTVVLQEVNEALIRFRLENNDGTRLRNVVFARPCLQKLADDSVRNIKIDYLRRDLERVSKKRDTYVYPHSLWAILDD